ncbi:hypothetical protein AB0C12_10345 [Actinoplanes sp. NPDC048967]|uniref:hypothetical protein n=1 Tax=Actinoplanes sp. NPDC048967 TaxID=3155269 RepID=UPI00340D7257
MSDDDLSEVSFGVLSMTPALRLEESALWRRSTALKWTIAGMLVIGALIAFVTNFWEVKIREAQGQRTSFAEVFFSGSFGDKDPVTFLGVFIGAVFAVGLFYWQRSTHLDSFKVGMASRALERAEGKLASQNAISLPQLWSVTQKRLDFYHGIATAQARVSFRNAQAAMVAGFGAVLIAAVYASSARTGTAAVATAALGGAGAALAAYIGRTFIRAQESAANHLKSYFLQPLEFSKFLAGERLLMLSSENNRDSIIGSMVTAILGGQNPTLEASQDSSSQNGAT